MTQKLSLWEYACSVYRQDGVEQSCLDLQDHHQINIPLLLFLCWAGHYHGVLAPDKCLNIHRMAQLWQSTCVKPLRTIRSTMKTTDINPITESTWLAVRKRIKAVELEAERALLETLESMVTDKGDAIQENNSHTGPEAYILDSLRNIYQVYPFIMTNGLLIEAITTILCAVQPQIQYDKALELAIDLATSNTDVQ